MQRRTLQVTGFALLTGLAWAPAACSGSEMGQSGAKAGGSGSAGSAHTSAGTAGKSSTGGSGNSAGSNAAAGNAEGGTATAGETATAGAPLGGAGATAGEAGGPDVGAGGAAGECEAVTAEHVLASGIHVTTCTAIEYATNPPSSGEHYPVWADFGVYDFPLPRGFWMHNLEHGAVVVTYNCEGCDADIVAAKAWLAGLSPDATCAAGPARVLLVPDPELDVPWAASAWGFTLRAKCFDAVAFSDFVTAHAGGALAPEAGICTTGVDFRMDGVDTCGAK